MVLIGSWYGPGPDEAVVSQVSWFVQVSVVLSG